MYFCVTLKEDSHNLYTKSNENIFLLFPPLSLKIDTDPHSIGHFISEKVPQGILARVYTSQKQKQIPP